MYAHNWASYGDPLSPLLERWRPAPDEAVVRFASYLREAAGERTFPGFARFLVGIVVPSRLGNVSTVLGVGALAAIVALFARRTAAANRLLLGAAAGFVLVATLGQLDARFLFESYLWGCAAFLLGVETRATGRLRGAIILQCAATAGLAAFAAASLFPGAVSSDRRQAIMKTAANNFSEAMWLDRVLPERSTVVADLRSVALIPRPWVGMNALEAGDVRLSGGKLSALIRSRAIGAVALHLPIEPGVEEVLSACGSPIGPQRSFTAATRNPFNRGTESVMRAWTVDPDRASCSSYPLLGDAGAAKSVTP